MIKESAHFVLPSFESKIVTVEEVGSRCCRMLHIARHEICNPGPPPVPVIVIEGGCCKTDFWDFLGENRDVSYVICHIWKYQPNFIGITIIKKSKEGGFLMRDLKTCLLGVNTVWFWVLLPILRAWIE